jgi:hypothetical protein
MANWHTVQSSFIGGEISPRFSGQVQSELNSVSLAAAVNSVIFLQGNITKRLGTVFQLDTGVSGESTARLWPFIDYRNRESLALFTAGQLTIVSSLDRTTSLVQNSGEELSVPDIAAAAAGLNQVVSNPYFSLGLTGWANSGVYNQGPASYGVIDRVGDLVEFSTKFTTQRIAAPNENFIRQRVAIVDATTAFTYVFKGAKNIAGDSIPNNVDVKVRVKLGTTEGGGEIFSRLSDLTDQITTISEEIVVGGGIAGEVWLEVAMVITNLDTVNINAVENYRLFASEILLYASDQEVLVPDILVSPYGDVDIELLHFIQSPFGDKDLLVLNPKYPPYTLYWDGGAFIFEEFVFAFPDPNWGENNWPSIATAYQGRLVLSGARNDPETVWFSEVYEWGNFIPVAIDPTDSDPIIAIPTERGLNTFLSGFKRLIYGNTRNEFEMSGRDKIITPTDIGTYKQSSYGSLRMPQKFTIGSSIVVPTDGNTTVKLVQYSDEGGGFMAPDVMMRAEHLGRRIIRRIFYSRDPHEILWAIMVDGSLCQMTFNHEGRTQAWTQWKTDGRFIDGCTIIDQNGRSVIVLVIERVINGVTKKYIETMSDMRNVQNWQYMDSAVRVFTSSDVVTGLDHLEGKEVHAFNQDQYAGTYVVEGAAITVENAGAFVDVGLSYDFIVTTLPENSINPSSQTGLTAKKRYSKVGVRGIFSNPPIIQGQRAPERSPQGIMNISQPREVFLETDISDQNWNSYGTITISEPLPLPANLIAIYGRLSSNEV